MKKKTLVEDFLALFELVELLRGPGGCPWDRAQTFRDLRRYILEEAYEVVEAIDSNDKDSLQEELGDLFFQVLFLSSMASETRRFELTDVLKTVHSKMVRRHPHVFGSARAETPDEVVVNWNRIKEMEKKHRDRNDQAGRPGLLSGVPRALPALYRGFKLTEKAADVGFDWACEDDIFGKLEEELGELKKARLSGIQQAVQHEIGDLLFVILNLARRLGVEPEEALQECNNRFSRRFHDMMNFLTTDGHSVEEADLETMDRYWDKAKEIEKKNHHDGEDPGS